MNWLFNCIFCFLHIIYWLRTVIFISFTLKLKSTSLIFKKRKKIIKIKIIRCTWGKKSWKLRSKFVKWIGNHEVTYFFLNYRQDENGNPTKITLSSERTVDNPFVGLAFKLEVCLRIYYSSNLFWNDVSELILLSYNMLNFRSMYRTFLLHQICQMTLWYDNKSFTQWYFV